LAATIPPPPLELAHRVGAIEHSEDPLELYEMLGRESHDQIVSMLPADWSFEGKRILDFGCGSGRTLRHFLGEAESAEFWGCDIDAKSIEWIRRHLSPPIHAFANAPVPPVSRPNGSFDLAYAISVFTHLTDSWSEWLVDLHRLLSDEGLLIATYMGEGMSDWLAGEPWDEDRIGMNILRSWQSWDEGGPLVLHSDWWIRAHWGRAFEIVDVVHQPAMGGELGRHSWALLRKRPGEITPAQLEELEPGEEREIKALRHNVAQLQSEIAKQVAERRGEADELGRQLAQTNQLLESTIEGYEGSVSWRMTKPLRTLAQRRRERA
jgi:SAM-dependent methyltransferase